MRRNYFFFDHSQSVDLFLLFRKTIYKHYSNRNDDDKKLTESIRAKKQLFVVFRVG